MNRQDIVARRRRAAWAAMSMALVIGLWPALPSRAAAAEGARPAPAAVRSSGAAARGGSVVSAQARQLVDWISLTGDHADAPFIIVDKRGARVLVFDASAQLRAHSAVLLGLAIGDDSVPGIGDRPMAQILPAERTTPAGRFVAERGLNTQGEDIVWVDYDAAISMHRVRTGNPVERRAQRLATPKISDNRISYGCINVPVAFYERHIDPIFAMRKAMVYVLPDLKPLDEVFAFQHATLTAFDAMRPSSARGQGGPAVVDDKGRPRKQ